MDNYNNSNGEENPGCLTSIIIIWDIIVAFVVGFSFTSGLHTVFRILISIGLLLGFFVLSNVTKFKIGLLAIITISIFFTLSMDNFFITSNTDAIWTWTLRICFFLISFFVHKNLTIWKDIPIFGSLKDIEETDPEYDNEKYLIMPYNSLINSNMETNNFNSQDNAVKNLHAALFLDYDDNDSPYIKIAIGDINEIKRQISKCARYYMDSQGYVAGSEGRILVRSEADSKHNIFEMWGTEVELAVISKLLETSDVGEQIRRVLYK